VDRVGTKKGTKGANLKKSPRKRCGHAQMGRGKKEAATLTVNNHSTKHPPKGWAVPPDGLTFRRGEEKRNYKKEDPTRSEGNIRND